MKYTTAYIALGLAIGIILYGYNVNNTNPTKVKTIENTNTKSIISLVGNENASKNFTPIQEQVKEITLNPSKNLKPNENGKIMVLMYHDIGSRESEWVRTPENFKKDLQELYMKGYRPISLQNLLENKICTPAGTTPFLLTFDDALAGQFRAQMSNESLSIDPDCAVGIMEAMKQKYNDFKATATFFVFYPVPFRQPQLINKKYLFLISHGYDIGNHSYNHDALNRLDAQAIQKTLALNVDRTKQILPGYKVNSFALPYGAKPKKDLYKYAISGTYGDTKYTNQCILLAGSNPVISPNHIGFDPYEIPRIRASQMDTQKVGLYDWLQYFDKNPNARYISDGDPTTITIPISEKEKLNLQSIKDLKIRFYRNN